MVKNSLKVLTILIIGAVISSCVSNEAKTRDHAEALCDCMKEIGLNDDLTAEDLEDRRKVRKMENDAERHLPKCALPILKEMKVEMDELGKSEKKEYTKAFLKNVIDTDCADVVLDNVPFEALGLLIDDLESQVDISQRLMNQTVVEEYKEGMDED